MRDFTSKRIAAAVFGLALLAACATTEPVPTQEKVVPKKTKISRDPDTKPTPAYVGLSLSDQIRAMARPLARYIAISGKRRVAVAKFMTTRGIGITSKKAPSTFGDRDRVMEVIKGQGSVLKVMEIQHR